MTANSASERAPKTSPAKQFSPTIPSRHNSKFFGRQMDVPFLLLTPYFWSCVPPSLSIIVNDYAPETMFAFSHGSIKGRLNYIANFNCIFRFCAAEFAVRRDGAAADTRDETWTNQQSACSAGRYTEAALHHYVLRIVYPIQQPHYSALHCTSR